MTLLTLEALDADEGDCLLLHHGTTASPGHILIDGGRSKVFRNTLRPRLDELRKRRHLAKSDPLIIELAVVTHVDEDHIQGLLALTGALVEAHGKSPPPWKILRLWLNDFDEVVNNAEAAAIEARARSGEARAEAVAASVNQGRTLRAHTRLLKIDVNADFGSGKVARPDGSAPTLPWDDLEITVLAPTATVMKAYEKEWDRVLRALLADEKPPSPKAEVINAASIALLVERGPHRLLLTGDARSEDVLGGLRAAGRLEGKGPYRVDVLKLPHHGAEGNCTEELFRSVHARHYLVSANGDDGNPDPATLDRLWKARRADHARWTLHVTFAEGEVPSFEAWREAHPEIRVAYRAPDARGISIELGDEHL